MMADAEQKKETFGFQTEVKQLLQLMIHSLYSNKEIFLRELISNASDAADKLRFVSLSDASLLQDDPTLKIVIDVDKDAKLLTIRDNGIGMSREEVMEHLGTIAKSGTKAFVEGLTGDQTKDSQMIGQFGVGFYSVFMVADKVIVNTRRAGLNANEAIRWESKGDGEYTVEAIEKNTRGTEVILHLKEDSAEFLDSFRLRSIVNKFSDHIALPIEMKKEATGEDEKKDDKAEAEYETVNSAKALWTRSKSEIKDEEYNEFYKHVAHDFEDPMTWSHNKVEGKNEYTSLLFIPSRAPFDLWDREQKSGLKLYVQRVFIMDNADILPSYLRFVKGVIDSNDLPLNVSREILQSNHVVEKIRSASVKKVLGMLEKMAENKPEQYATFWKAFGNVIKEGPAEDFANREQLMKLLRFSTTHTDSEEQTVSLSDYVSRMKPEQQHLYYITAESFAAAKNSPHLEILRKKGIEVILMSDRVDEWLVSNVGEFDGKTLLSVSTGDLKLDGLEDEQEKEAHQETEKDFESVVKQVKEVLGDKVKEVRLTYRLTDSPACVVADDGGMSMNLQRMLSAAGQAMPEMKPVFELNPEHALVQKLKAEQDDTRFAEWSELLLDQALLAEGSQLKDPVTFVKRVNKFLMA